MVSAKEQGKQIKVQFVNLAKDKVDVDNFVLHAKVLGLLDEQSVKVQLYQKVFMMASL